MEKNIHDDQFDDYVKGSFDDYEELPASNMWGRIEKELAPQERKRRIIFWWWAEYGRRTAATAAILLLMAGIVGEYFYFEAKLQKAAHENQLNNGTESNTAVAVPPTAKTPVTATPQNKAADKSYPFSTKSVVSIGTGFSPAPPAAVQNNKTDFSPAPILPANTPLQVPELTFDVTKKLAKIERLDALPTLSPRLLTVKEKMPLLLPLAGNEPVVKAKSNWYAGIYATPARFSDEKTFRPPAMGRRYASLTERAEPIIELGARVGTMFGQSRLGVELGLSYRAITRNGVHFPRFRFAEGVFRPGLPNRNYDFSYGLDTYGGTAEVTVRMEQVDNNPNVNANEAVSLRVFTREKVQVVRVPLLLTARLGNGKLTAQVKAGLVGNFILQNEINFTSRISTSNRFRIGQTFTVQKDEGNRFIPGYQVSAGLHWAMSPHWSLVAEPTLAGDFSRNNKVQTKLPGLMSYGLNIGVNRSF